MRFSMSQIAFFLVSIFLGFQQAQAQDCLTLGEFRGTIVGECYVWSCTGGETKTACVEAYEEVPTQPGVWGYRTAWSDGYTSWHNIVGTQSELYRECYGGSCGNYIPPWIARKFPLCLGLEWNPHPDYNWTAKVVTTGLEVTVPAGTFHDCVKIEDYDGATLVSNGFVCPCVRGVKLTNYSTSKTCELQSYDICPDLDGDGYWDSSCMASRTCGGDCNDNDVNVNPGETENCGNGIDDNCNGAIDGADCDCGGYPCTANAEAATYGSSSLTGSGIFNELILLVIPVGAVIILSILRRRR